MTKLKHNQSLTCAIVGARGYTGLELARLLLRHPQAQLSYCFATTPFQLSDLIMSPRANQVICLRESEIMNHLPDVIFLATPAEASMALVPQILSAGKKVIDLSGAFRLKSHSYQEWYGFSHKHLEIVQTAEYGLSPWIGPQGVAAKNITGDCANLIANPGCYATAIAMALIPLLKFGIIDRQTLVIDAKSGTSGGGKKASENLLFTEVAGECLPYKVGRHQHLPEVKESIYQFSGKEISPHFTTSLLPIRRGIIAGIYCELADGHSLKTVAEAFKAAYERYPLLTHGHCHQNSQLLSLKKVVGTGRTHLSYEVVGQKLYLFSCIDNLLKGAASQAVENFNRICDLPLDLGVNHLEAVT